ncbi:sugar hydrolase [Marinicrinis lubricantis]|uniref:Sugar hydrolase n=1 Tax=Marinicrinis lubricantis TaxID=2086470 RepID=A0ABW1IR28_9BACL
MAVESNLVQKAQVLIPSLHESIVRPAQVIEVVRDEGAFQGWSVHPVDSFESLREKSLGKNDSFVLDFGDHQVGYLALKLRPTGSPADAPLRLKLIFGEMPCEIGEDFDDYDGWLSRSWLQDEIINIDVLPCEMKLPRRYAFRYVKIIVMETSVKFNVQFEDIYCTAVTSADWSKVKELPQGLPDDLREMDRIGMKTLADCMQTVFEDGPKRDRRLWIGDLRLQALANYETFRNFDLVKRCMYLFGGMTLDEGKVGACVFEKPEPHVDDTVLYDYSLFFIATLHDYYVESKDIDTLQELWPAAWRQAELALQRVGDNGIVADDPSWWCFVDWHPELNKQASAQAILIYCLKRGLALAEALSLEKEIGFIQEQIARLSDAAFRELFDAEQGFFVSGGQRQISWASQVWMVLAEVMDQQGNQQLMNRLFAVSPEIGPNTPYMVHHLIEALLVAGDQEKALEQMRAYWGEMVKDGADTFWEVYHPQDKKLSPYGSNLINSYCHAWSCTTSYFIRKYFV